MDHERPESSTGTNHGKRTRPLLLQPSPKIARLSAYSSASSSGTYKGSKKFYTSRKSKIPYNKNDVPAAGTPVPDKHVRKAGPYLIGPKLGPSPVKSIVQCLARREKTDDFYQVSLVCQLIENNHTYVRHLRFVGEPLNAIQKVEGFNSLCESNIIVIYTQL